MCQHPSVGCPVPQGYSGLSGRRQQEAAAGGGDEGEEEEEEGSLSPTALQLVGDRPGVSEPSLV